MATQTRISSGKSLSVSKLICGLVIVVLAVFGGFYFYKYQDLNSKYQEQNLSVEDKKARYIEEVSKLYELPSQQDEDPTFAIVTDQTNIDELKQTSEFYNDVQSGDVLLLYQESDISIIYRPNDKKIINTGKYTDAVGEARAAIAIIAPNKQQDNIESQISEAYSNILIVSKTSPSGDITKGIVVDVNGSESEAAKQLADILNYEVGSLPSSEKAPEGAQLIIVAPSN